MAKDQTEEAGIGHNGDELSKADFLAFYRREAELEAELEIAREKRKKLRKEMKAGGVKLWFYDAWKKLNALEDEEQAKFFGDVKRYAEYMGAPMGEQFEMKLDPSDLSDESDEQREARIVKRADSDGYQAGVKGTVFETDNPHTADTSAGQAWIGGYRRGQEEAARKMGPLDADSDDGE